ncbi:VOC family protein [Nonomuraea sp. NBC_01738]|uniref:VOC family protein n=1 Tax=Nonomuraea sp. NBC_01738 TaxID=2976003 RepID=UPI002E0EE539|nr:VOC family protein [Nonomuraea sp. NBC_01738]
MAKMIFVNLPVQDLDASKRFFVELGFSINPTFTDETASCVVISDTIFAMLLTEDKFKEFAGKPQSDAARTTEVMVALSAESREEVDRVADAALAAGGSQAKEPTADAYMYGRSFYDLDGHHWEIMWMDPAVTGA